MQTATPHSFFQFRTELVASGALFFLLLFSTLAPLFTDSGAGDGNASGGDGNLLRQVVYLVIFGAAIACAGIASLPRRLAAIPLSIVLTLVWCAISMAWAINPGVGARRLFLTAIVIVSLFLLVERTGFARTLQMARVALVPVLAANYLAVIASPAWGIHQAATEADPSVVGAWRGILLQKNFAGAVCALTVLFFLFDSRQVRVWIRAVVIALASYFLYRSESKTSAALLIFSAASAALLLAYDSRYRNLFLAGLAALAGIAVIVASAYREVVLGMFASEDTLTGRVQIWPPLFQFWREHWLEGSGFGSFWNIGHPEPIAAYTDGWVAQISSGHNGFLDLLVQIGLPGLLLTLLAVVVVPVHKLLSHDHLGRSRRSLLWAVIAFGVGHNFTESSLFNRDATVHVFLILAIALLGLEVRAGGEEDGQPADTDA